MHGRLRRDTRGGRLQVRQSPGEEHLRLRIFVPGLKKQGTRDRGDKGTRSRKPVLMDGLSCVWILRDGYCCGLLGVGGVGAVGVIGFIVPGVPTGFVVLVVGWPT